MPDPLRRLYLDSSVYGGAFDPEFADDSLALIELIREGYFSLVVSPLLEFELAIAPDRVAELFWELASEADVSELTRDVAVLHSSYLIHGIVRRQNEADALHVALATTGGCHAIVSWNFRHIVQMEKIRLYNAVNQLLGYNSLAIHSPSEVLRYEEED